MHNIRSSDNICGNKLRETQSNSNSNTNRTTQASCPHSGTFVNNINNYISLTEPGLPSSNSEAQKFRREVEDRNLLLERQVKDLQKLQENTKEQEITKDLMLLELIYSRYKNENAKNYDFLRKVKKHFEKNLAKMLAESFVKNMMTNVNSENLFKEILGDYLKKKNDCPSISKDTDSEVDKDYKSQLKVNMCVHQDKPHYAKVILPFLIKFFY